MGDLTKNFSKSEFAAEDGRCWINTDFVSRLQTARDIADVPFNITSGCRTEEQNKRVGGVRNSAHLRGLAADIAIYNTSDRYAILRSLFDVGFTRVGLSSSFIHVDDDFTLPTRRAWVYS